MSFNICFIPATQVLERKEWKNFRTLVSSKPQLRRCGRRLPRYCDVNNDRKISITEWLNCISTNRTNTGQSTVRKLALHFMFSSNGTVTYHTTITLCVNLNSLLQMLVLMQCRLNPWPHHLNSLYPAALRPLNLNVLVHYMSQGTF